MNHQSRFDAGYRMLGTGALEWPRGMVWGGRWEVGSGLRMRNMYTPVADSCWCMAKPIQYCKVISLQLNKLKKKKKIRDTKRTFHTKMTSIEDRNDMDLTEAEDIKRWQKYTEELYKKDLHDPVNHDGMITHLEPDILECEVKWALESFTTKLVEGMEFQVSYFNSSKMMLSKCCTQYTSKFGELSSGHRTGKGQFSFQSQRKAMPKNDQTITKLHSCHMLVK